MAENSKIEWTHHTFNPWVGCTKVSPACDHCYAESWAKRSGSPELWQGERRRTSASNWRQPLKWNANAEVRVERHRVFCASLADVFDNQVPQIWRADLFALIEDTPHLDWLLLTKRPQNIDAMTWPKWDAGWPRNIWLGVTAENRQELQRRWPHVSRVPVGIRFLSAEPYLGEFDMLDIDLPRPDWIIVGGESGSKARPTEPDAFRRMRDECALKNIAFFMKQMTRKAPIPPDLLVRQFPTQRQV